MNGKLAWFEIATNDLERAKDFYANVFGHTFTFIDMPGSPMYTINVDMEKGEVGGALVKSDMNVVTHDGCTIYFSCDDVDIEAQKAVNAGGKLLVPKMSLGEFGFMAHIEDTEGNKIGLHSMQ